MKKIITLLSLFFIFTLLVPTNQAEAARGSGGIGGFSGRGGSGGSDRHQGSGRFRGSDRHFGPKGFKGSDRHHGHRSFRVPDRHRGHGRHRVFGGFLPGLAIGGILGWGFGPRYYYPPTYQDPYPSEGDQPTKPSGQGPENRMRIYPRQGQSEEQQALDFDECHSWAVDQAEFDPEIPPEGPPDARRSEKSADYMRAISACLDARGYDLR